MFCGVGQFSYSPSLFQLIAREPSDPPILPPECRQISATERRDDRRRPYEDDEIQFLQRNYMQRGAEFCARHLSRSINSVRKQAEKLGMMRVTHRRKWSRNEDRILLDFMDRDFDYVSISRILNMAGYHRTAEACFYRYKYMNEHDMINRRPKAQLMARLGLAVKPMRDSSAARTPDS